LFSLYNFSQKTFRHPSVGLLDRPACCMLFTQSISTQLILTFRPCRCYLSALLTTNMFLCRLLLALLVDTAFRTLQTLIPTSPSFLTMCAVHLFLNVLPLSAWFLHCNTVHAPSSSVCTVFRASFPAVLLSLHIDSQSTPFRHVSYIQTYES